MSSAARSVGRPRRWPLGAWATALLIAACAVTGAAAGLVVHHGTDAARPRTLHPAFLPAAALRGDAVWPAGARPGPPFALRDQSGRTVSLAGQRRRPVLLAFMDSHCKLICTLEGPSLRDVQRRVGAARMTLLIVSVNPWEDTAGSSVEAATRWGLRGDWHWLRGTPAQLRPIWRAYGIEVARTAGDVGHSTAIYLIDRRGYERAGFNYPFPTRDVVRDLTRLTRNATRS